MCLEASRDTNLTTHTLCSTFVNLLAQEAEEKEVFSHLHCHKTGEEGKEEAKGDLTSDVYIHQLTG